MLAETREAAREAGIIVFPAVELSIGTGADEIHLIGTWGSRRPALSTN